MVSLRWLYTFIFLGTLAQSKFAGDDVDCSVVAVGGGWAGVYFAYRYFINSDVPAHKICIFEASQRIGGRTFSKAFTVMSDKGQADKFVLDVGAYRFSPDMHLPGDIIMKHLQLPTACYEPDCEIASKDFPPPFHFNYTAPLRRIVDPVTQQPAGYVTAMRVMVEKMQQKGVHIMLGMRLLDIMPDSSGNAHLLFGGGVNVTAHTVLLNLPRTPVLSLPAIKSLTSERTVKMLECIKFDRPEQLFPNMTFGKSLAKAYAYYDDAWWHNHLNMTEGQLPQNAFIPLQTSQGIPIGIHFNDGPVICDAPHKNCRGFLEVFYTTAPQSFFDSVRVHTDSDSPLGVLNGSMTDAKVKLAKLHKAVMEATKPLFDQREVAQPVAIPRFLVVGVWDRTGHGYTAPTKVYFSTALGDSMEKACGVPGLTEKEYRDTVLTPFGSAMPRVHLANNDWVAQEVMGFSGDWAEESLLQAERALSRLGLSKPSWLDSSYYQEKIQAFLPKQSHRSGDTPIFV